jgi:hypothetical protein
MSLGFGIGARDPKPTTSYPIVKMRWNLGGGLFTWSNTNLSQVAIFQDETFLAQPINPESLCELRFNTGYRIFASVNLRIRHAKG